MFFFWTLFLSILRLSASRGWTIITAEAGQTVSLPCRAGRDGGIRAVEWDRSNLGSDYVFLFRNNKHDAEGQHPSYKNRVNLQDRQMKDGNVSLVLKDVTTDDEGIYECRVTQTGGTEYTATVFLEVSPRPPGRNITVTAGDDVILPCRAPARYKQHYDAVEWSRGGLETGYVLAFRDGTSVPHKQLPSYQNRVDLQDGDVSLVLKNVTINDAGIYGCRVIQGGGYYFISIVHLEVSPPPSGGKEHRGNQDEQTEGHPRLAVGLPAAVIIVTAAAAGVWIYMKKKISASSPQSDSEEKVPISSSSDQTDQLPDV